MSNGRQMAGSPDVGAYIRKAIGLHQAGHLPAAEQMYREILKVQPHNYDALHLLGVLLHQKGRV